MPSRIILYSIAYLVVFFFVNQNLPLYLRVDASAYIHFAEKIYSRAISAPIAIRTPTQRLDKKCKFARQTISSSTYRESVKKNVYTYMYVYVQLLGWTIGV